MIRFDHISKQYAGTKRPALNDVTLEVLRGEFVFLVGASGSGKSSCLRLILKEEKPTRGKLHVLGQDLSTISNRKVPYFRRNLGVVFQDFRLLNNKTVYDNVAFTLQVIGKSRGFIQEAVPDVLNMVGLDGKAGRMPHELSGGEQQRVAIARAVVNKPQILLADEPTGNLDPATSAGIMAVLERINAGGTTVLMATHEAGIVDKMQKRVIELSNGDIVRDERHGGYGVTAAVPVQAVPEEREQIEVVPEPVVAPASPIAARTSSIPRQPATHAAGGSAPAAGMASAANATQAQRSAPSAPPPPPPAPSRHSPVAPAAAGADAAARESQTEPAPATGAVRRPTPPSHDLPEQLSLAEKLGLRAPGHSGDSEQNVGPVK